MAVLVTDSALESLLLYRNESKDQAQSIERTISSLRRGDLACHVLKLSGSQRPIWTCEVSPEYSLYFTIGQGPGLVETRIVYFGSPLPGNSASYKELLFLAGEAPYYALSDHIELEDSATATEIPLSPESKLPASRTLNQYLHPSDRELTELLENHNAEMDDLNGRPFRLLNDFRSPVDLPARLSPQQRQMLVMPRPVFVQGVAGSGKTTLLTHFAHQELVRSRNSASIW